VSFGVLAFAAGCGGCSKEFGYENVEGPNSLSGNLKPGIGLNTGSDGKTYWLKSGLGLDCTSVWGAVVFACSEFLESPNWNAIAVALKCAVGS
jgi:hypothetical protein